MKTAQIDQCVELGIKLARRFQALGLDPQKLQEPIEKDTHPFWTEALVLGQVHFGMPLEEVKQTVLEWLSDWTIPSQTEFSVAEKFTKSNPNIQFWYFGDNFESWFTPTTEKSISEATVSVNKLRIRATLAEMTPEQPAPRLVTMSQIYWMLAQQPKGEKPNGKNRRLLVNGYVNLFRVIDANGEERAVYACWFEGNGWFVYAYELELGYQWHAGYQAISRK